MSQEFRPAASQAAANWDDSSAAGEDADTPGKSGSHDASPTEVRDVCSAGDTVFAALAVEIVTGRSLRESCRTAMGAAGRGTLAVWMEQGAAHGNDIERHRSLWTAED
jgi:fructose-1-phosphate kinase PfkB-like protein